MALSQSVNPPPISPSALAARFFLPARRLPHVVTAIGDSRIAAIYLDGAMRNLAATSPLNWANAMLGQRLVIGDTFGVSGNRTDQMLARLTSAIATGAGLLYIQGGVNDIAQNYPTTNTSGATAFANIKTMAEAARGAGMIVVIEAEIGGNTMNSAAFCAQVNELNALLYEYAERTPGVYIHDARPIMLQPAYGDSALQCIANYSYDGTHVNGRGAMYWGQSLASLLSTIVPPRFGPLLRNRIANPANAISGQRPRQLCDNPIFQTATGGTLQGTGASGTVPASWTGYAGGGGSQTVAFSTQADPGGLGNNVLMAINFAAGNDEARLYQAPPTTRWAAGDIVEGFADVSITGTPTGLLSLKAQLSIQVDGVTADNFDLHSASGGGYLGPDKAIDLVLRTRPYTIPAYTAQNFLQMSIRALAAANGSANITVRQMGVRRRSAA